MDLVPAIQYVWSTVSHIWSVIEANRIAIRQFVTLYIYIPTVNAIKAWRAFVVGVWQQTVVRVYTEFYIRCISPVVVLFQIVALNVKQFALDVHLWVSLAVLHARIQIRNRAAVVVGLMRALRLTIAQIGIRLREIALSFRELTRQAIASLQQMRIQLTAWLIAQRLLVVATIRYYQAYVRSLWYSGTSSGPGAVAGGPSKSAHSPVSPESVHPKNG